MTTLRRELRKKFEKILNDYIASGVSFLGETVPDEVINKLVDTAMSTKFMDDSRKKSGGFTAWDILHGAEITQEAVDNDVASKQARDDFEVAFGFNPPWFSNKDWTDFADFVHKTHAQDQIVRVHVGNVWNDYCLWRETDGKYGRGMTNVAIRKNPVQFMDTGYPTFEARKMYWTPNLPFKETEQGDRPQTDTDGNIYV